MPTSVRAHRGSGADLIVRVIRQDSKNESRQCRNRTEAKALVREASCMSDVVCAAIESDESADVWSRNRSGEWKYLRRFEGLASIDVCEHDGVSVSFYDSDEDEPVRVYVCPECEAGR